MTAEHRDKFRFSYLIIAQRSTFSKDKLHYYYASFFLTSFHINHAHLPHFLPSVTHNVSVHHPSLTPLIFYSVQLYMYCCICYLGLACLLDKTIQNSPYVR